MEAVDLEKNDKMQQISKFQNGPQLFPELSKHVLNMF